MAHRDLWHTAMPCFPSPRKRGEGWSEGRVCKRTNRRCALERATVHLLVVAFANASRMNA
jgi:hypothetical protein